MDLSTYLIGWLLCAYIGALLGMFISNLLILARMIVRDIRKWRGSR